MQCQGAGGSAAEPGAAGVLVVVECVCMCVGGSNDTEPQRCQSSSEVYSCLKNSDRQQHVLQHAQHTYKPLDAG
jgi:hypothetical protein